jgi:hypothetical protein
VLRRTLLTRLFFLPAIAGRVMGLVEWADRIITE